MSFPLQRGATLRRDSFDAHFPDYTLDFLAIHDNLLIGKEAAPSAASHDADDANVHSCIMRIKRRFSWLSGTGS